MDPDGLSATYKFGYWHYKDTKLFDVQRSTTIKEQNDHVREVRRTYRSCRWSTCQFTESSVKQNRHRRTILATLVKTKIKNDIKRSYTSVIGRIPNPFRSHEVTSQNNMTQVTIHWDNSWRIQEECSYINYIIVIILAYEIERIIIREIHKNKNIVPSRRWRIRTL